mgnify:CR=1 FL=1
MNEEEARIKIGDRMCKRLDIINSFLKHFGYGIWLHSTSPSSAQKIIKEQDGLRLNLNEKSFGYTYESKQALLENIDVPDEYLKQLEETAKNNPGVQVDSENDEVMFNGEKIVYREFVYIMLNKPKGYVCSNSNGIYWRKF